MNAPGAGFRDGSSARRRCHGPFMISSFAARVTLLLLPVPVDIVCPPRDFRPGFRGLDHPAAGGAPGMAVRHRELWWTFEDVGGAAFKRRSSGFCPALSEPAGRVGCKQD